MKKKTSILLSFIMLMCSVLVLSACQKIPEKYNVYVNVWYSNYGMADIVEDRNTFDEDTDCTITATPKQNSTFIAWIHENVVVSYESTYSFKVNNETSGTYTAIFTYPEPEFVTPKFIYLQEEYTGDVIISSASLSLKMGSSYHLLHEVFNDSIMESDNFSLTEPVLAFNSNNTIYCEANLTYTFDTIIDEEITPVDRTAQTYFEINLTELLSSTYSLNLPDGISGNLEISLEFEELVSITEEPEDNIGDEQ